MQQLPKYGLKGQQPQQFDFQGQGQYYQPRQGRGRSAWFTYLLLMRTRGTCS